MKVNARILKFNNYLFELWISIAFVLFVLVLRYLGNYLVFHTFSELFSIIATLSIALITYSTYNLTQNRYLLFLGLGYFWIGILDILHTQSYPGMHIYDIEGMNPSLTFWIFTRFFEAMLFVVAPLMRYRNFSITKVMLLFALYAFLVILLSFSSPLMLFHEDGGLTLLKIISEYGIILLLVGALKLNSVKKSEFHVIVYNAIQLAIIFTIISELFFTLYSDVYSFTIVIGHIFKFLSFWILLISLIKTSIQEPLTLITKKASSYNAIPLPAILVSSDGIVRQVNRATEKYLGLNSSKIIGQDNHKLFHPSNLTTLECPVCQAIQKNKTIQDLELIDNIKQTVTQYSLSFIKEESQQGVVQICVDVTKIYKNNKELQTLKERMELALKGSKTSLLDWDLSDNSFYISSEWKEMLGFTDKELPNSILTWKKRVHRDDRKNVFSSLKKCYTNKMKYYENTHRLKHRDGHYMWILGRAEIHYNDEGKAIRMIGTHTNITEQKELQLKSAHQAQMIEQINDSVVSSDLKGFIVSWNLGSQKLFGYTADEVIGKHISILHRKEDRLLLRKHLVIIMKKGIHTADLSLVTKSKDIVSVSVSLSLLRDENGVPINFVSYAHDITRRKEAEDALMQQRDMLDKKVQEQVIRLREKENLLMEQSKLAQMGDMINMIAHQWRQPLSVVSTTAIKLTLMSGRDDLPPQKVEKLSGIIQDQAQAMSTTIDDFMNFNKELDDELFLVSEMVSDTLNIIATQLETREISIDININTALKVFHNKKNIDHSLLNLLVNARDAFDEHPEIKNRVIKIYTKEFSNRVELIIEDNAGGIPEDIIGKIFNPYFTTKEQGKGTGIGLYMVKNLIETIKGSSIRVKALESGSQFIIQFEKDVEV